MLDYHFKVTGMNGGQSRKADVALAFAAKQALDRFALPSHNHIAHDGDPIQYQGQRSGVYRRLMCQPVPLERFKALSGRHIQSEARRQAHRLLREDIDAAWGEECMVQRHLFRVFGGAVRPRHPINTQPRGFARLDEAFEATFDV